VVRVQIPRFGEAMKVACYARVSTDRQDLEVQLQDLREFAARRGWEIVGVYEDVISGASLKRPGLNQLLNDAHRRKFDLLLIWKLDRLGRSLLHMVQVIHDLLSRGIEVVSATEPHMDSTTPQGRLLRNIFASVAEYERSLIIERVKAGLRRARAEGKHLGRRPRSFDQDRATALYAATKSWRKVARVMQVPLSTLHRRMAPKPPVQNSQEALRDGFQSVAGT
jgi:DNA invertase Pin-like site-specific DNA recombinase